MEEVNKERFFSVELKSKANLKNVTVSERSQENVLIEGTLGKLKQAEFDNGVVLVVFGDKGVLRVNLTIDDIKTAQSKPEVKA